MTNPGSCSTCGKAIENERVTGILCQACHDRDLAPKPGWQAFFTGPLYVGLIAVVVPFFFSVVLNGFNVVAAAGGGVGVLAGVAGLALGARAPSDERGKKIGAAVIVVLLGGYQILSSGALHAM